MIAYPSGLSPQQKAAYVSAQNRKQRARERREREARHARLRAHPGIEGHPWACVCDDCEARRPGSAFDDAPGIGIGARA